MRCPECSQRNSVAARTCKFCGRKFKRKPVAASLKVVGAVLAVGAVGAMALSFVPSFKGQSVSLSKLGDRMAAGPKSAEDAQEMKAELDAAIVEFLKKNGQLSSADLLTKLQAELPTSTFEVLVFDLPRQMKLVEVDCVLQPSDYLIVPSEEGPKTHRIANLSIFDEARLISDKAGPYLVLVGHTSGAGGPNSPQLKILAVLPNNEISDRTDKLCPLVRGDGTIKFDDKSPDILLSRTLLSTAQGEGLFTDGLKMEDETFTTRLKWKDGHYQPIHSFNNSELAALYSVASSMVEPSELAEFKTHLASNVQSAIHNITESPVPSTPEFKVSPASGDKASSTSRSYNLDTTGRRFEVSLLKAGRKNPMWTCIDLKEKEAPATESMSASAEGTTTVERNEPARSVSEKAKSERSTKLASVERVKTPEVRKAVVVATKKPEEKKAPPVVAKKPEPKAAPKKVEPAVVAKKVEPASRTTKPSTQTAKTQQANSSVKTANAKSQSAAPVKTANAKTPQTKAPVTSNVQLKGTPTVTLSSSVNVRSGPATSFSAVTTAKKGASAKILGKKDGWYEVLVDGQKGFVYGGLVDYKKSDGITTAIVKQKKDVKVAGAGNSVATTAPGDKVVVVGGLKDNKYTVRLANGKLGYLPKDAVDVAVEEPAFVP